jgi:hypothetical protein
MAWFTSRSFLSCCWAGFFKIFPARRFTFQTAGHLLCKQPQREKEHRVGRQPVCAVKLANQAKLIHFFKSEEQKEDDWP